MRDAKLRGDTRRVAHILTGAARALAPVRRAVIVKLQGDADDIKPGTRQQGRGQRRVDPARHRDDNAVVGRVSRQVDIRQQG